MSTIRNNISVEVENRRLTLTNQETDADTTQVESIQPVLNVKPNIPRIHVLLPLKHALCDGRHRRVVTSLDILEQLRETSVVVV